MKSTKTFPFERARRINTQELNLARRAIEALTGEKRPLRGRPPKIKSEKYRPVAIRLHPRIIYWAKKEAKKRGIGYQTVINEVLLKKVA